MTTSTVYFHGAEQMAEIEDHSVDLFIGGGLYFDQDGWEPYRAVYEEVYNREAYRVLKVGGLFVAVQSNMYRDGRYLSRQVELVNMLADRWELFDERIWARTKSDMYQVPFSNVMLFRRRGHQAPTRRTPEARCPEWRDGVWSIPQAKIKGMSHLNAWPEELCRRLVQGGSDPGGLVVDAFAGSGRLLGVAAAMGRVGIGYEIDPDCLQVIRENGVGVVTGDGFLEPVQCGLLGQFGM